MILNTCSEVEGSGDGRRGALLRTRPAARVPGVRRRQPHVREHRLVHAVHAQGVRRPRQVHPGGKPDAPGGEGPHRARHPEPDVLAGCGAGRAGRRPVEAPFDRGEGRVLRRRAALQAHAGVRHRPRADVADARQCDRAGDARGPVCGCRVVPRAQPVDARALDVQLRERGVPHTDDLAAGPRSRVRRAGVGRGARRARRVPEQRAGQWVRRSPFDRAARVRPVLDADGGHRRRCRLPPGGEPALPGRRRPSSTATARPAGTSSRPGSGWRSTRTSRSAPCARRAGRSPTSSRR